MTLRRRWRMLLLSLTAIFAVMLFLLYSETALRWGVSLVAGTLIKPLTVTEVQGRLAGPVTLSGIEYDDSVRQLSLEQLILDWQPSKLLLATVHVNKFHATGLSYRQQPQKVESPEPKEKISLPQIVFPLKIIIDDAKLDGVTFHLSADAEPLTVTQISLQAETSLNTLRLHTLQFQSDWLMLRVSGDLEPRQDYRTALDIDWTVPQQNNTPWRGQGTLKGNTDKLKLDQQLASPFAATLMVEGKELLNDLTWKGRLDIPQMHSSQLPFTVSPAFTGRGVVEANGNLTSIDATTRVDGLVETVGNIKASANATYLDQQIQLTNLLVTRQGDPARLEASGEINLVPALRFRMQARWGALSWPADTRSYISENGNLTISGENKQYQFITDFLFAGAQIPSGEWQVQGNGDDTFVSVDALEGKLLNGTVVGTGSASFAPEFSWQGQLQGNGLNPAGKWPQWPGSLAFAAELDGRLTEKARVASISLPSLSGTLRERKLQGRGEAEWRGDIALLKRLELQLGSAKLQAKGQLAEDVTFNWQLEASDMGDLLPKAQGSLNAGGEITGPLPTPRFTVQLGGNHLNYAAYRAEKIQADISLNLQQDAPSSIDLQLEQLQLPGFPQQSLSLTGQGPLSAHRLALDSHNAGQSLNMELTASYAKGGWAGTLNQLQIADAQLGQWRLIRAAAFNVTSQSMRLDEICLLHEEAKLCTRGSWDAGSRFSAELRSTRFPLALLQPYLPKRFAITGELDGKANLSLFPNSTPRLESDLTIGSGSLVLINPDTGTPDLSLAYQGAAIKLDTSEKGRVNSTLTLTINERDQAVLAIQSSLAGGWPKQPMKHPVNGNLTASLGELEFISSMVPEVQNFQGRFDADVRFAGTLSSPRFTGYASLDGGQLDIPSVGLKLTALHLDATARDATIMEIGGGVRSGDGELVLSGELAQTDTGGWGLELSMKGSNFEVARIPEARMQISPALKARIVGRKIRLEGEIDIPMARLEPPEINLAVKPSDDVIIVNKDEDKVEPERWLIHTRIRMTAADTIRFIGYGLDGRIGGDLLLIDEPGSLTRARGQLHVVPESTYKSFGTKLSIERGQLNFTDSPVDNPNLDIRASRTIRDVIAGVNITGTAKNPILTLYSEPPMDQADILSYITLGHPMGTSGQSEGAALAGAANTAGLIGGNYLASYIGRQFGLEEASVEADPTTQSPWVVMGTYLSPRLYLRYGVGIYEDAYSIIVRYQLSEHWQVQGEGGTNSGADILYTFERP